MPATEPTDRHTPDVATRTPTGAATPERPGRVRRRFAADRERSGPAIVGGVVAFVVVVALVGGFVVQSTGRCRVADANRPWMRRIADAIERHRCEHGRLPSSLDELVTPDDALGLRVDGEGSPVDPWGVPYAYFVHDDAWDAYEVRSAGDDKALGTEDDVVERRP